MFWMGILKGMQRILWFAFLWLMLSACTATAATAVPQPTTAPQTAVLPTATFPPPVVLDLEPTVAATDVPNPTATTPVEPTGETAVVATGMISGRTDEGAFFLGDPNAPITHIDYSDFL